MVPKFNPWNQPPEFNLSLAEHLRSAGWAVYTEIPLGAAQRESVGRADVLALKKSFNVRIQVYECKISRGDFLRDIGQGKFERYFQHAHQVYFALPAGVVKKEEVPEGCGLIIRGDTGWHTIQAAKVHEVQVSMTLLLACLFREQEEKIVTRQLKERINLEENVALADQAKNLGGKIARKLRGVEGEWECINDIKAQMEQLLGKKFSSMQEAKWVFEGYLRNARALSLFPITIELVDIARDLLYQPPEEATSRLDRVISKIRNGKQGQEEGSIEQR